MIRSTTLAFELGLVSAVLSISLGSGSTCEHHLLIREVILLHLLYCGLVLVAKAYVISLWPRVRRVRAAPW